MDEMRQSVEGFAYEGSGGDVSDLCRAGLEARLGLVPRSDHWGGDLARLVEAEIIPRLMIVHRPESHAAIGIILPSPEQIETFSTLMLAPAEDEVEARIAALIDKGLTPESLLLDLLAPTARHLGVLWEEDLCDFTEVTVAMGRLQRIMHEVTRRFGGRRRSTGTGAASCCCPVPANSTASAWPWSNNSSAMPDGTSPAPCVTPAETPSRASGPRGSTSSACRSPVRRCCRLS